MTIKKNILANIKETDALIWYPNLSKKIGQETHNLDSVIYDTSDFLTKGLIKSNLYIYFIEDIETKLEYIPEPVASIFLKDRNLSQSKLEIYNSPNTSEQLIDAYSLIGSNPSLKDSVYNLTKSIHLIDSDPRFDVSFTNPNLPHSIFISLPTNNDLSNIRLAEAIIHESMHLQLTLIENQVELISNHDFSSYSPWTQSIRPIYGLLHALYVFSVIYQWLNSIDKTHQHSSYIEKRLLDIERDVAIIPLKECYNCLTDEGKLIFKNILKNLNTFI